MRVGTEGSENHQICDVHNPHAKLQNDLVKESSNSDHFECDLHINTDENNIWTETFVGKAKPPDVNTSTTMNLRLLWAEPNGRGVLRAGHGVNIILRADAVSDRAQEAAGI